MLPTPSSPSTLLPSIPCRPTPSSSSSALLLSLTSLLLPPPPCLPSNKLQVSRRLTRGDFFGELALLSSDKRAATVTAVNPVTVLSLKRDEFTRLLGPLKDIMSEAAGATRT